MRSRPHSFSWSARRVSCSDSSVTLSCYGAIPHGAPPRRAFPLAPEENSEPNEPLFSAFVIAFALSPTPAVRASSYVDGKAVYAKNCQSCHGADGHGETPAGRALKAVSLIDPKWATPEVIPAVEKAIREGVPRMPTMKAKLTAEEIAAVARYAQQLASGKP